jgi:hypothetical protein
MNKTFNLIFNGWRQIDYLVLGLSQGRNTRSLYEYAEEKGIIYVYADEILNDLVGDKSFKISSAYT